MAVGRERKDTHERTHKAQRSRGEPESHRFSSLPPPLLPKRVTWAKLLKL